MSLAAVIALVRQQQTELAAQKTHVDRTNQMRS